MGASGCRSARKIRLGRCAPRMLSPHRSDPLGAFASAAPSPAISGGTLRSGSASHPIVSPRTSSTSMPKAFHPIAQGCRAARLPWVAPAQGINPEGVAAVVNAWMQPLQGWRLFGWSTQGSSYLATLGCVMKRLRRWGGGSARGIVPAVVLSPLGMAHAFAGMQAPPERARPPQPWNDWNSFIYWIICCLLVLIAGAVIGWICWWGIRQERKLR
jgi:disulfide bond formation protein DsbB